MAATLHAFDFLDRPEAVADTSFCVLFGDEPFLQGLVQRSMHQQMFGADLSDAQWTKFDGDQSVWRDVQDELATVSLFGTGRRVVLVEAADKFVKEYRELLEAYAARSNHHGLLVLSVDSWLANTRLFKVTQQTGLQIDCRPPQRAAGRNKALDEHRMLQWLAEWSSTQHDATLPSRAAELLLELVGPHFGLLDQELAKLALFAGPGGKISSEMVRDVVGGWRTKTTWELIDAAASGNAAEALQQLDELLQSGESAHALFGQISWSLRRFALATRIVQQTERDRRPVVFRDVLLAAGFQQWPRGALEQSKQQLIQIGRERADRLFRQLLEADLALKGSHSSPHHARRLLEHLILQLAGQMRPTAKSAQKSRPISGASR